MPTTSSSAEPRRIWPQLRALFVAFHLLAITLDASPSPAAGMNRAAWKEPTVQQEFKTWSSVLGMEQAEFETFLWDLAQGFMGLRKTVMTPFSPYLHATGSDQAWQMFVAPHRYPTRMQLQVNGDPTSADGFRTVFEERSSEYTWRAERFNSERLRASIFRWGWPNYQDAWKRACKVFARELLAENPESTAVRCRMFKLRSPSPEEVEKGTADPGKWVFVLIEKRPESP
jgi:hypothetical protein